MSLLVAPYFRVSIFILLLIIFCTLSYLKPFRSFGDSQRVYINLFFSVINSIFIILIPFSLIEIAQLCQNQSIGFFNQLQLPTSLSLLISIFLLDLVIYFQHRLSHKWSWFWRLHRFHHSDIGFDTTTGVRFHPFEIMVSFMVKAIFIAIFGPPVYAVILFEIILSSCSLFNHSNIKLPRWLEAFMSQIIITPDLHRVHHSVKPAETNSNYGFSVVWWDKLFKSFRMETSVPQSSMPFGLEYFRKQKDHKVMSLLLQPFDKASSNE